MLLRLCVAVFLITGVQTALADSVSAFEASLAAYQAKLPSGCQIKSPAMKVIYACSKIQGPDANPRFQQTIDAGSRYSPSTSSNGVNFCYNSLVEVQRNGGQLIMNVTRDSGQTAKMTSYRANLDKLTQDAGAYDLPIKGFEGLCFGYTPPINSICGFGADVPMVLRVTLDSPDGPRVLVTADRMATRKNNPNRSQVSALTNDDEVAEAKRAAIIYARKQLYVFAKLKTQTSEPKKTASGKPEVNPYHDIEVQSFRQCDEMLINLENSIQPPIPAKPEEEDLRAEYRRRVTSRAPEKQNPPKTGR